MKYSKNILALILLAGCSLGSQPSSEIESDCFNYKTVQNGKFVSQYCHDAKDWRLFKNNNYGISIPGNAFKNENSSTEIVFDSNPSNNTENVNDYFIKIRENASDPKGMSYFYACNSTSIINPLTIENSKTTHTITGKIPNPPCEVDACDNSKFGYDQFKGRYVLCSEHKDKTIRIEVNQVTDDPKFAEQIFSTFHWTK